MLARLDFTAKRSNPIIAIDAHKVLEKKIDVLSIGQSSEVVKIAVFKIHASLLFGEQLGERIRRRSFFLFA